MPIISYMGTKAALAREIVGSFEHLPAGPLLDLFAGMATIGRTVAPGRNVWLNDVQLFSRLTSELQFLNCDASSLRQSAYRAAVGVREVHAERLMAQYRSSLAAEEKALSSTNYTALIEAEAELRSYDFRNNDAACGVREKSQSDYDLFTSTYSGTYFGLRQCIEIDAVRKAIDAAAPIGDPKLVGIRRWFLAALGSAASRCSNSTGHFAQYLTVSEQNARRVASQRRRSIIQEWRSSLRATYQVGNYAWRRFNKTFSSDACELLGELRSSGDRPAVIYADPPYTSDQYSRYYHILETLVRYDYPVVSGKGLYRPDRFVSSWSLKAKVRDSFAELIANASALRAALVISYPTNGLLRDSENAIPEMLRQHFRKVSRLTPVAHQHSTMGASKGSQRTDVTEQIFVAR